MSNDTQKPTTNAETEIGVGGVGHPSNASASKEAPKGASAESVALTKALETINMLQKQLEAERSKPSQDQTAIKELTAALRSLRPEEVGAHGKPVSDDAVRAGDVRRSQTLIDGNGLMQAQRNLMSFSNEAQVPVSVPKSLATYCGTSLAVAINGVRISVPADGKVYMLPSSFATAVRERIAKLEHAQTDNLEPQITTIEG
ncbi:hypothetical protein [Paratractidigestivibacter sp.]|uniref:hypothetical protein n=1 Tax=Paratractidigestivibacter sp. TaxID=2847316 RepID=UPI002AC92635|nr:hypothetical protein [Paratractidigestivibacter sp.]